MRKIFQIVGLIAMLPSVAPAQTSPGTEYVLGLITKTADDICRVIQVRGETSSSEVKGEVRAEISGLASKLANAGIEASAIIAKQAYDNVLQKDLATTINNNTACRLTVFESLQSKLIPTLSLSPSPKTENSTERNEAGRAGTKMPLHKVIASNNCAAQVKISVAYKSDLDKWIISPYNYIDVGDDAYLKDDSGSNIAVNDRVYFYAQHSLRRPSGYCAIGQDQDNYVLLNIEGEQKRYVKMPLPTGRLKDQYPGDFSILLECDKCVWQRWR